MAPAVTFVRGTHLVTGGSTGQLVPNSSMKVKSAKKSFVEDMLAGAGSGHRGRAWGWRNRRTLLQRASGFKPLFHLSVFNYPIIRWCQATSKTQRPLPLLWWMAGATLEILATIMRQEKDIHRVNNCRGIFIPEKSNYSHNTLWQISQDGMVFLVDRKKELIKVKGLQVLNFCLHNHALTPKQLGGACWTGESHQRTWGCNWCCCYWSCKCKGRGGTQGICGQGKGRADRGGCEGEHKRCQSTPDLVSQGHVAAALSPHKHLAGGVEFVEQIPKSAAGKILRKDLKASYQQNINGA